MNYLKVSSLAANKEIMAIFFTKKDDLLISPESRKHRDHLPYQLK